MKKTDLGQNLVKYIEGTFSGCVLINGEWGSGKTHYVNEFTDSYKRKSKTIFMKISLYGLNSIDQVTAKINSNVMKTARKILNISKGVGNAVIKNYTGIDIGLSTINFLEVLPDDKLMKQTKSHILVFDDLERCQIPIKDILGYINNLNENFGYKIIVIADTTKICGEKEIDYQEHREKIFSFTYKFEPTFEDVAKDILESNLANKSEEQIEIIIRMFLQRNVVNLRTIIKLCDKVNLLFSFLKDEKLSDDIKSEVIRNLCNFQIDKTDVVPESEESEGGSENGGPQSAMILKPGEDNSYGGLGLLRNFVYDEDYIIDDIIAQIKDLNNIRQDKKKNPLNKLGDLFLADDSESFSILDSIQTWVNEGRIEISRFPDIINSLNSVQDKLLLLGKDNYLSGLVTTMKQRIDSADTETIKGLNKFRFLMPELGLQDELEQLWGTIEEKRVEMRSNELHDLNFSDTKNYDEIYKIDRDSDLIKDYGVDEMYNKIVTAQSNREINNIRGFILAYYRNFSDKRNSDSLARLKDKLEEYVSGNKENLEKSRHYILSVFIDTLEGKHYGR